jgi:hypothetical protein
MKNYRVEDITPRSWPFWKPMQTNRQRKDANARQRRLDMLIRWQVSQDARAAAMLAHDRARFNSYQPPKKFSFLRMLYGFLFSPLNFPAAWRAFLASTQRGFRVAYIWLFRPEDLFE